MRPAGPIAAALPLVLALAAAASGEVEQEGNLIVHFDGGISPACAAPHRRRQDLRRADRRRPPGAGLSDLRARAGEGHAACPAPPPRRVGARPARDCDARGAGTRRRGSCGRPRSACLRPNRGGPARSCPRRGAEPAALRRLADRSARAGAGRAGAWPEDRAAARQRAGAGAQAARRPEAPGGDRPLAGRRGSRSAAAGRSAGDRLRRSATAHQGLEPPLRRPGEAGRRRRRAPQGSEAAGGSGEGPAAGARTAGRRRS